MTREEVWAWAAEQEEVRGTKTGDGVILLYPGCRTVLGIGSGVWAMMTDEDGVRTIVGEGRWTCRADLDRALTALWVFG
jgi:hypothetical protein